MPPVREGEPLASGLIMIDRKDLKATRYVYNVTKVVQYIGQRERGGTCTCMHESCISSAPLTGWKVKDSKI